MEENIDTSAKTPGSQMMETLDSLELDLKVPTLMLGAELGSSVRGAQTLHIGISPYPSICFN